MKSIHVFQRCAEFALRTCSGTVLGYYELFGGYLFLGFDRFPALLRDFTLLELLLTCQLAPDVHAGWLKSDVSAFSTWAGPQQEEGCWCGGQLCPAAGGGRGSSAASSLQRTRRVLPPCSGPCRGTQGAQGPPPQPDPPLSPRGLGTRWSILCSKKHLSLNIRRVIRKVN